MTFKELHAKHSAELQVYLESRNKGLDEIREELNEVRKAYRFIESDIPAPVQKVMEKYFEKWQREWGVDGRRNIEMKERHKNEVALLYQETYLHQDWQKDNDRGR